MVKAGLEVTVEHGAGLEAFFPDAEYEAAGAQLTGDPGPAAARADAVLTVTAPEAGDAAALKPGRLLVGLLAPHRNLDLVRTLAEKRVNALAMELVPRITRAQTMDALSSQANIAGYKAVLLAALRLPKYMPLLMTAAGTIKPARVVVMGAGVAGLQAIATAKRLGAIVEVSDIRAAASSSCPRPKAAKGRAAMPARWARTSCAGSARSCSAICPRRTRSSPPPSCPAGRRRGW